MTALRKREAQLAFEALYIEGGLLSPEWLAHAAQLQAGGQSEADYRVPKGLSLRDEIGRYWRIAQAHFIDFAAGRARRAEPKALAERFVVALLRDSFGFASLAPSAPVRLGERAWPIGHCGLGGRVPVIIASAASGVETADPAFGDGGRRRSAFGLAQEYLNADERALWGLVSDGIVLRILRDNASLTRPVWIEADLGRIFAEERYADFAALWLLAHETRFGALASPVSDCALESWRSAGREEGTRAREHLRVGVEEALIALGQGFLSHADNQALRAALEGNELTKDAFFQQLLRLVYRLIFLLTAEERRVLHAQGARAAAQRLYEEGYSLRHLRDRSVKRSAHDHFSDLWQAVKIVIAGLAHAEPRLGLPALAGLFAAEQCPALDDARLENRWLLAAVFKLCWLHEEAGLARVNWRDMGPEELGSVYESLLELVPQISQDGRGFSFATGTEATGNARKESGSYYTPDSLVQVLLDSGLEPVVQRALAAHPEAPVDALLSMHVVDPACGSGHFLLAAARRLATHVARVQANGTPSSEQYRHALRQVVGRCIFGVDLNPMAVELCKVSLWMEAVEPGRPLSFLDSHVQRGNALFGATPEMIAQGIPDVAWEPVEDDDKKTASLLKKRNKSAAQGQRGLDSLWAKSGDKETAEVSRAVVELDAAPDTNLEEVSGKETRWGELQTSAAFRHQRFVSDAWCAAFVWPKPATEPKKSAPLVEAAPTNELWRQIRDGQGTPPTLTVKTVEELAKQYRFFHWRLAFPQVFARGGFDVVLGNPPYGHLSSDRERPFLGHAFPLAVGGELEHYSLFVGAGLSALRHEGLLAYVLPDSWMSNEYRRDFRRTLAPLARELIDFGKPFEDAKDTHVQGLVAGPTPVTFPLRSRLHTGMQRSEYSPTPREDLTNRIERSWCPYLSELERRFIGAFEKNAVRLEDVCRVLYGLRTGNNKKYLTRATPEGTGIPAFGGEDIVPFGAVWKPKYLVDLDERLRAAAREQTGQPKLAVQRIRTNSRDPWARWLEVGFAPRDAVCLDSVTFLTADKEELLWFVLGLLSSTPMNQYHRLVTSDVNVKPTFLRRLPVPSRLRDDEYRVAIADLARVRAGEVAHGETQGERAPDREREIDRLVYDGIGIEWSVVRAIEARHWEDRFAIEYPRLEMATRIAASVN